MLGIVTIGMVLIVGVVVVFRLVVVVVSGTGLFSTRHLLGRSTRTALD